MKKNRESVPDDDGDFEERNVNQPEMVEVWRTDPFVTYPIAEIRRWVRETPRCKYTDFELLCLIQRLDGKWGCWAGATWFAEQLICSVNGAKARLKKLTRAGVIITLGKTKGGNVFRRLKLPSERMFADPGVGLPTPHPQVVTTLPPGMDGPHNQSKVDLEKKSVGTPFSLGSNGGPLNSFFSSIQSEGAQCRPTSPGGVPVSPAHLKQVGSSADGAESRGVTWAIDPAKIHHDFPIADLIAEQMPWKEVGSKWHD